MDNIVNFSGCPLSAILNEKHFSLRFDILQLRFFEFVKAKDSFSKYFVLLILAILFFSESFFAKSRKNIFDKKNAFTALQLDAAVCVKKRSYLKFLFILGFNFVYCMKLVLLK